MALPYVQSPQRRPALAYGVSVLAHALVLLAALWRPDWPDPPPPEPTITVELVPEAPKTPSAKSEPPKADKLAPPPPPKPPAKVDQAPPPPDAPPAPLQKLKPGKAVGGDGAIAMPGAPLTVNERDLILAQVLRKWKPPRQLAAFPDASMSVGVTVLADGTLAPPFSARAPYDPGAAIDGYNGLPPDHLIRLTTEAFYRALRDAQPFRLPAAMVAKAPFDVTMVFRYRDVR